MGKAGIFAGEVTPLAPADGASTIKQKGYQWMEYGGGFFPASSEGGIAGTQYNYTTAVPSLSHPFASGDYSEMTFSFVGRIITPPTSVGSTDNSVPFCLSPAGVGDTRNGFLCNRQVGVAYRWLCYMFDETGAGNVATGSIIIPDADITDWWWVGFSYSATTTTAHFVAQNLTKGTTITVPENISASGNNVKFFPSATSDGTPFSPCHWGFESLAAYFPSPTLYRTFKGYLSQVMIHNKYIDLSILANRNLFCAADGVIDYGVNGEIPFGEQPLVYLPNGHPSTNKGTLFIGNWEEDFYVNPATVSGPLPPQGS